MKGFLKNGSEYEISVYDKNKKGLLDACKKYGVTPSEDNKTLAKWADILFLAVKPNVIYSVIDEIKKEVNPNTIIVSIAAGQSIEKIEKAFGKKIKLVRVMPNTPALVGEGMSALVPNSNLAEDELAVICNIFKVLGKAEIVSESMMDAVTAVSGSSPAYIFMIIEAMADGAVMGGLPRDKAYTFAAQAVLGSAKMVLETGTHPAELKDSVCSPAGTTIEAVKVLEERGLRSAVIEAMQACMEKSKKL